jgi:hypothetical protein
VPFETFTISANGAKAGPVVLTLFVFDDETGLIGRR